MTIMIVQCPNCQKRLKVTSEMAGRRIGCNACRTPIDLPAAIATDSGPATTVVELPPADVTPNLTSARANDLIVPGDIDPPDNRAWIDRFAAAGLALLLQAILLLGFAIFAGGQEAAGEQGVAVVLGELDSETLTDTDDGQLEEASAAGGMDASNELTTNVEVNVAPGTTESTDGIDTSLSPTGGASGGGSGGGDGFGFGKGSGLGGEANFLGVPARGHRFCIIADNSGSMNGPPLAYLKVEINKTLNAARGSAKFYVVFFNSVGVPQPQKKWVSGKKEIDALAAWVQGVPAAGGTNPYSGFEVAFQIDPPPDVVYFMTDGGFAPQQVQQIAALNAKLRKPATIHGIAFGRGAAGNLIQQIAKDGKGTFRTVNGP